MTKHRKIALLAAGALCCFSACRSVRVEQWTSVPESRMPAGTVEIVLEPGHLVFGGKPYTDPVPLAAELEVRSIHSVLIRAFNKIGPLNVDVDKAAHVIAKKGKRRVFLHIPRNAIDSLGYVSEFNWRGGRKNP